MPSSFPSAGSLRPSLLLTNPKISSAWTSVAGTFTNARPMISPQFLPASANMDGTVRGSTSQRQVVDRTEFPSSKQWRIVRTLSAGSRSHRPRTASDAIQRTACRTAGIYSVEVRCGPYRPSPCRFCNCGTSLWTLLSSGKAAKMTVSLVNSALRLSEARPHEQLALLWG